MKTGKSSFKLLLLLTSCLCTTLCFHLPCNYDGVYAKYAYCDRSTDTIITKLPLLPDQPLVCDPVITIVSSCPSDIAKCQYDVGTKQHCDEDRRSRIIERHLHSGSDPTCRKSSRTVEPCGKYYKPTLGGWHQCAYTYDRLAFCKQTPTIEVTVRKLETGPPLYCPASFGNIEDCEPSESASGGRASPEILKSKCIYVANAWLGCANDKDEFRITFLFLIKGDAVCPKMSKVKTRCISKDNSPVDLTTTKHV